MIYGEGVLRTLAAEIGAPPVFPAQEVGGWRLGLTLRSS